MARRTWVEHPDLFEPNDMYIVTGTCKIPTLAPILPPPDYSTPQAVTERIREAAREWARMGEDSVWYYSNMLPALSDKTWGRAYHAFREACQRPIPEGVTDAPIKPARKARRRVAVGG